MSDNEKRIWYSDSATVARFLLGGIGTGNVSVGSRGQLCDWELFNSPNAGTKLAYTFFSLRTQQEGGDAQVRILESRFHPPYESSQGYISDESAGIPRFEHARLAGEISRAVVELRDCNLPVDVDMTAFSPFIPLDADNSGIPAAVIRYKVINTAGTKLYVSLAGSLCNAVGYKGDGLFNTVVTEGKPENQYREEGDNKGIFMSNPSLPADHLSGGSMAFCMTGAANITAKPCWAVSPNWNGAHEFWYDFVTDGKLGVPAPEYACAKNPHYDGARLRIGSLCADFILEPKEVREIEFILTWHFPNRPARWPGHIFCDPDDGRVVRNYYATQYSDAWDVLRYLRKNLSGLEKNTDAFRKAFYQTSLPAVMLDAMAANITVLRSTTCFRIEDGTFLGWEGTFDKTGSCEGNCSHVWNYQQTLAFLFPELERDMRRVNFLLETGEDGEMAYRSNSIFGYPRFLKIPPASDGQMGTIIQLYRDWKLSGDDGFLREMWSGAVRALDYAFTKWDQDGDFVFEAEQHNTYDIEFYGITSMINSIFYAALKAGEEMAAYLGDDERVIRYKTARVEGSKRMDELLFNGEYYIQKMEDGGKHHYQYREGCLSDQVLGQELAHVAGLGYILPEKHIKKALEAVYRHNFRSDMSEHINVQRVFALNNDGGLLNCTWPNREKPVIPFIYSDEVWTGVEYQVSTHLIYEGYFDKALEIVEAVRGRYDGIKRNPWNEVECGNHYVRAMASWGLLLAASGFGFDLTKGEISFAPRISEEDFTCFFSTAKCWGLYRQKKDSASGELKREVEILYGNGEGIRLV